MEILVVFETEEERRAKLVKKLEQYCQERSEVEARRRQVWALEEAERIRRIKENGNAEDQVVSDQREQMQEELLSKFSKAASIQAEESERERIEMLDLSDNLLSIVVRQLLTKETRYQEEEERKRQMMEGPEQQLALSDVHEAIQQEFMSKISLKETKRMEEEERDSRVFKNSLEDFLGDLSSKIDSAQDAVRTKNMEEEERKRRITEDVLSDFHEAIKREVIRRQTWVLEEKERVERILEEETKDLALNIQRNLEYMEVIALEEEERKRRMKEGIPTSVAHDTVQEQFMSKVHRKEVAQAEEEERKRRIQEAEFESQFRSEIDRRVTWILEEEERRRRVYEDIAKALAEEMERKLLKNEVIMLEEKERARRIRVEKTHPEDLVHSNQMEAVQQELSSAINLKMTKEAEEKERTSRMIAEQAEIQVEQENRKFESQLDLILVKRLEEKERNRRMDEDLKLKFEEATQSELSRRTAFVLEEMERQRRIAEKDEEHTVSVKQKALLMEINQHVAKKLNDCK